MVYPLGLGLYSSFTSYDPHRDYAAAFVGIRNYSYVLSDPEFHYAARNVALFTFISVAVELAIGIELAYALRRPFRGRGAFRVILLIPWLISPVASGVMWHFLLNRYSGLVNFLPSLLGLSRLPYLRGPGFALPTVMAVEIWRKAPLVSFLVLPAVLSIPLEQWEIAELEGMPHFKRIRHIVLPRLRRLLLTVMMLLAGDSLGTFESILMLTAGGPGVQTVTMGLYSYRKAFVVHNWIFGSTSAWLITTTVLLVGFIYISLMRKKPLK